MISKIHYIFFIILLVVASCGKNEFTLEFEVSNDVTDNYNVTYYATDLHGGLTIQAVASLREGKCELNGATKRPTLIFLTARRATIPVVIVVDRGQKIEITGQGKDPLDWDVNGSEINENLSQWRRSNIEILNSNNPDSINIAVKNFVEENASNPASAILMLCYYQRDINEREYSDLMASLSGEAKSKDLLAMIGRSDQLYHSYSYPARLESLIMRGIKEEGDTFMLDNRHPLLLLVWQTGYSDRKVLIDSIKTLEKEIPDTSFLIADICADVDSTGWRSAIRRDSLDKIKRFWAPLGINDPTLLKLKVNSLPYFIVFEKNGVQSYRGTDLSDAIKDYRKLIEGNDTLK